MKHSLSNVEHTAKTANFFVAEVENKIVGAIAYYCSLLIAHCSLLIAHCSLLIVHCSLLIAHCSLPIVEATGCMYCIYHKTNFYKAFSLRNKNLAKEIFSIKPFLFN